jgi:hypothetical protein
MSVNFHDLPHCNLNIDEVYGGGESSNQKFDAISHIFTRIGDHAGAPNSGGFRLSGSHPNQKFCCLYSSQGELEWPDHLDEITGTYTYFGDNREPGKEVGKSRGNKFLESVFEKLHAGAYVSIPPIFIFHRYYGDRKRAIVFKGLAVPGAVGIPQTEDLIAIWKSKGGRRFQNYRALFTVLDVGEIPRAWINEMISGQQQNSAPDAWRIWQTRGVAIPLTALPVSEIRSREQQLPQSDVGRKLLSDLRFRLAQDPYKFERVAVQILRLYDPRFIVTEITRRSSDGGRDAFGTYRMGPQGGGTYIEWALEAKCYSESNSVGVKEVSRLISRLKHRQIGILVTTSYLGEQAYREILEDRHPVMVVSAGDISEILLATGTTDIDHFLSSC